MFVVDANVLLHAVNSGSRLHPRARELLEEWLSGPHALHLTWGIAYEFLRVATHRAVFAAPLSFAKAFSFLEAVLENDRVDVLSETREHLAALRTAVEEVPSVSGIRFHDLHTALLMKEHRLRDIRTADVDFHRFGWVRATNPLQA